MKVKQRALPALQRRISSRCQPSTPGPAQCEPHVRSSNGPVGGTLQLRRAARFSRGYLISAGNDETLSPAGKQNEKERKPRPGNSRIPAWRCDPHPAGARFVMECIQPCPVYPFSPSNAPSLLQNDSAGFAEIFAALKINPNSGLRPSDTRSHGFRKNSSLSSGPPFPTSTERGYSLLERADQDRSVARADLPQSAGIP